MTFKLKPPSNTKIETENLSPLQVKVLKACIALAQAAQLDGARQVVEYIESKESVAQPNKEWFFTIFRDDWQSLKELGID